MNKDLTVCYRESKLHFCNMTLDLIVHKDCKRLVYHQGHIMSVADYITASTCAFVWRSSQIEPMHFSYDGKNDFIHVGNNNIYDTISLFKEMYVLLDGVKTKIYVPKHINEIKINNSCLWAVDQERSISSSLLINLCRYAGQNVILHKISKTININGLEIIDLDKEKYKTKMVSI